jgi:hypothetical protein
VALCLNLSVNSCALQNANDKISMVIEDVNFMLLALIFKQAKQKV